MYKDLSKIVYYRRFENDGILSVISEISEKVISGRNFDLYDCRNALNKAAGKLLDVATRYGFNGNLWQNYLTYLIITDENPFSIACERCGFDAGSAEIIAKGDFAVFIKLYDFDFSFIEEKLSTHIFSILTNYKAIEIAFYLFYLCRKLRRTEF